MNTSQRRPSAPITVIDGGMGKELARIGAPFRQPEWSAAALIDDPPSVAQAHRNFVEAGAQVIIANTYAVVPFHLGAERFESRGRELADLAGRLARQVADEAPHPVRVAGSLPPLFGSYDPDRFDPVMAPAVLDVLVASQALYVDLWMVETVGSVVEAEAALAALDRAGVAGERWVAFSLVDEPPDHDPQIAPVLWSGESVMAGAEAAIAGGADAILINCATPEAVSRAMPELAAASIDADGRRLPIGAYANGFPPKPEVYSANDVILGRREDLTPEVYADHVDHWVELGASIVGGCCAIHPAHIAELARRHSPNRGAPLPTEV